MKNVLLYTCVAVSLFGCNLGCEVEKVISNGLANGIAGLASCGNPAAVQADVLKVINITKFCAVAKCVEEEKLKRGTIANEICPLVAATATAALGNALPATWQCNPSAGPLGGVAAQACLALPF